MKASFICSPKRTPIGSFQGSLSSFSAPQLGASVIKSILKESHLDNKLIEEVYMGCVLTAGLGQAPARQAAILGGLSDSTPSTTVGKVCGSGLKSVMLADSAIRSGAIESAIAGGMESMSNAPYLVPKIRTGIRMGHGELIDSMIHDGLWDVYNNFHMGTAAETCAKKYGLDRKTQDDYAILSYSRALEAIKNGLFKEEIVPLEVIQKKGNSLIEQDEEPFKSDLGKIPHLKPVFDKSGTITAANASTLNDGAAAMIVCSEDFAKKHHLNPLARIVTQSQYAQAPEWFSTAPAYGIESALKKSGLSVKDIDRWEINEAFAAVALANAKILEMDPTKINLRGGAVALGHPIGASGARIIVTLLHQLKQDKKKLGLASLCIGGGEAVTVIVENLCL